MKIKVPNNAQTILENRLFYCSRYEQNEQWIYQLALKAMKENLELQQAIILAEAYCTSTEKNRHLIENLRAHIGIEHTGKIMKESNNE